MNIYEIVIEVSKGDGKPIKNYHVEHGNTSFQALERAYDIELGRGMTVHSAQISLSDPR